MRQQSLAKTLEQTKQEQNRHKKQPSQRISDNLSQIIEEYTVYFSQVIGEGTYGRVYKASKRGSQELYACKFIKQDKIDNLQIYYNDKKMAQQLEDRLRTQGEFQMSLSECPYIVKMYKTQKNEKGFYFFMENCETDLAKLLKKEGFFPEQVALQYFRQIVEGIKFIYERNAFHRDLKPQNLLLKNRTIKISDFGFVKIFTDIDKKCKSRKNRFHTQSRVGTFRYMSPDILSLFQAEINECKMKSKSELSLQIQIQQSQGIQSSKTIQSKYDPEKSDVWSLGIILYKMLYGKQPYDEKSYQEMLQRIKQTKLDFPRSIQSSTGKNVKINVSKNVIKLIKKMLNPDQNQRIDFMRLYSKLGLLLKEMQKEESQRDNFSKPSTQQLSRIKKQRLLNVYNKIMIRIYKDLSNYATLREIGIESYTQFSYKIMTFIHEKRTISLQSESMCQKVNQQMFQYHSMFYQQIKSLAKMKPYDNLPALLLIVYKKLQTYDDFDLLIKQVQLFLLFLLQLCCLQLGIINQEDICATEDRAESLRSKQIVKLKNDSVRLISHKVTGKQFSQISKQEFVQK